MRELETLNWVGRIRDAIDEERLVLHAQPIIDVPSRRVVMYELLIRMLDRDGTMIPPGHFLPASEQFGLIKEIDRWVLGQAVGLAAQGLKVHFNISGKSLGSRELISDLVGALRRTGADPALLVCEITETALAHDEAVAEAFVHELAELGCEIALDDFGMGYGGFAYLKRLPLTVLKIEMNSSAISSKTRRTSTSSKRSSPSRRGSVARPSPRALRTKPPYNCSRTTVSISGRASRSAAQYPSKMHSATLNAFWRTRPSYRRHHDTPTFSDAAIERAGSAPGARSRSAA